jgi:hypothetical protein
MAAKRNNNASLILENESDMDLDEDLDVYEDDDEDLDDEDDIEFVEDEAGDPMGPKGKQQDTSFVDFVNPVKTVPFQQVGSNGKQQQQQAPPQMSFGDFGGSMMHDQDEPPMMAAPQVLPSEGYATLEDEKTDLLIKLDRLKKRGLTSKTFDVHHDILELRSEAARIRSEAELENSIQFSQRMLIAAVSVIEWGNKKYDPFDLYLDGWSMSIADNVNSFDSVLEKLYFKYRNKVNMPPEMELMMSLAGSAFMFHMTNSMFKKIMPNAQKPNPDMLRSMMSAFSGGGGAPSAPPPSQTAPAQQSQASVPESVTTEPKQGPSPYQMKGPGLDLGPMMSLVGNMGLPSDFMKPPDMTRPVVETRPPNPLPGPSSATMQSLQPPPPATMKVSPLDVRIAEDRLSDIISEDLESITGLSDMSSVRSSQSSGVRKVNLQAAPAKKRRGRKPAGPVVTGKVMLI